MKFSKYILVAASIAFAMSSAFAGVNTGPDAESVDSACSADAATASCTGKQVGTGLRICLHAYKKANPSFHFSPACKAAMQKMHADKKAGNAAAANPAAASH